MSPRLRAEPACSSVRPAPALMTQVMGRHWMIAAGHPLAAQAGSARARRGRQCHRRGCRRGHDPRRRPSGHGELRGALRLSWCTSAKTGETFEVSGVGPYPQKSDARTTIGRVAAARSRPACSAPSCPPRPMPGDPRSSGGARCRSRMPSDPALECAAQGFPLSPLLGGDDAGQMWSATGVGRPRPRCILQMDRPPAAGPPAPWSRSSRRPSRSWSPGEKKTRRRGRVGAIRAARDAFYKGEIARRIADFHAREGGLLDGEDLADFSVDVAPALRARPSAATRSPPAASGARGRCCCRC